MEITPVSPEEEGFDPAGLARVKARLQVYIDEKRFTGFSALIARHGRAVYFEQLGWRDPEARAPMSPDTIFRVYSMTKPVVASALMTLYEEERFQLSDPVSRFLPAFSSPRVLVGRTLADSRLAEAERPITIQDLLTHTSGLTYGFLSDSPVSELYRRSGLLSDATLTLEEMIDRVARLPLAYQPGRRWHYGVSLDVAARLIEVLSDRPLRDFLRERIFLPLGMVDTGYFVPETERSRIAAMYGNPDIALTPLKESFRAWRQGYFERVDVEATYPSDNLGSFARGGHGLFSTAQDYLRFGQALLNGGELEGVRILKPATIDLMRRNHLPAELLPMDLGGRRLTGYGFGLGSQVLLDVAASGLPGSEGEYGWGGAAKTQYWVDPKQGIVAILLSQYMAGFDMPEGDFKALVYQALVRPDGRQGSLSGSGYSW